jgi:hypothetical protein
MSSTYYQAFPTDGSDSITDVVLIEESERHLYFLHSVLHALRDPEAVAYLKALAAKIRKTPRGRKRTPPDAAVAQPGKAVRYGTR